MNQIGCLRRHQALRLRCSTEDMLLQQRGRFSQAMGQGPGGLKLIEGNRPTVLPVQGQTSQNGRRRQDAQEGSVGDPMKAPQHR